MLLLTSCGSPFNSKNSNQYQIPWRSDDGHYSLQAVRIDSLSDPDTLSGPLVKLFVTPSEEDGKLNGPPAIGRFMTRKDGVKIPLDFVSLQGATIQANFQKIHEFDRAAGADSLVSWPLEVSVETSVDNAGDNTNNAFFDGKRNAILILPYTDNSKTGLPISLNGGVLAHEHFHALFFKLVMEKMLKSGLDVSTQVPEIIPTIPKVISEIDPKVGTNEPRVDVKDFNDFLLRGLNEGLADFWSWLAVGDDYFVGRSLTAYSDCRRLDKGFNAIPTSDELRYKAFSLQMSMHDQMQYRSWIAYQLGAQYARFFKELAVAAYGENPTFIERVEMGQAIIRALGGEFASEAVQEYSVQQIAADKIVDKVVLSMTDKKVNEKVCTVVAEMKTAGSALPSACDKFSLKKDEIEKNKKDRLTANSSLESPSCIKLD